MCRSARSSERATLFFGVSAPDAVVLVRAECELQTELTNGTAGADPLGAIDLVKRFAREAEGEKRLCVYMEAGCIGTPG